MAEKTLPITGGCMCGAVHYETTGEPFTILHCHCQSCRRHTGAPVVTLAVFKVDQVKFSGDKRKVYESSPGVGRAFCAKCGTPLTWETSLGNLGPLCSLHVSTSDNPDELKPVGHTFYSERITWFDVADSLPRYEGMAMNSAILHHGPAIEQQPD